jgi:hypothetical protein
MTAGAQSGYDARVFTLRKGKMIRAQVHTDTAVMERVYGKQQVAPGYCVFDRNRPVDHTRHTTAVGAAVSATTSPSDGKRAPLSGEDRTG